MGLTSSFSLFSSFNKTQRRRASFAFKESRSREIQQLTLGVVPRIDSASKEQLAVGSVPCYDSVTRSGVRVLVPS